MSAADDDPGYFGRYNVELLKLIPPDAETVLEIGCGEGALCEAYRLMNPGVRWIGIDNNTDAVLAAVDRVSEVYCEDVATISWRAGNVEGWDNFECLVAGDILEHLPDPWTALKSLVSCVKPGGQVLASIPNIQHWTAIRSLMEGRWDYEDEGLFDRTHLRFFTRKSIEAMFADAGLQVFEIRGRRSKTVGFEAWWDTEIKRPKNGPLWVNSQVYQWIVRAVKPCVQHEPKAHPFAMPRLKERFEIDKLHIHAITAEACCARPRILEPFAALETIPGVRCTTSTSATINPAFGADITIQQRFRTFDLELQRYVLAKGSLIIAELDDHPDFLEGYREANYMQLRAAHAVQVSTEPLAEVVRQFNPNVMVVPNQIAVLPPLEDRHERGYVKIFFGAQNRQADWKPIMGALNRIICDAPSRIHVTVINDREFYQAIDMPECYKAFIPFCDYHVYRSTLRGCDIALLPLEDTPFNRCKSDIKFLECAAEGVVVLASDTVYGEPITVDHQFCSEDKHGFIYETAHDFEVLLRRLIDSPEDRKETSQDAYAYVRDNRLQGQHFRKQLAWYRDLLGRKPELTRQLLMRCRDLAGAHTVAPGL